MRKPGIYNKMVVSQGRNLFLLMIFIIQFIYLPDVYSQNTYTDAREKLIKTLKKTYIDESFEQSINWFYYTTCDSLIKKKVTIDNRPIQVILTRLFDVCENKINNRLISILRIPSVNHYFLQTIKKYKQQPINILYREIGITRSAILESAFDGIPLGDSISTFVGLREMLNTPYYISTRIHQSRYARFKDTLLYFLANAEPDILINKLAEHDSMFTTLVKSSNNMTVKAVSQIKNDQYFDQILPFSLAILENRISPAEVINLAKIPQDYYCAFIEEAIRLHTSKTNEIKNFLAQPIEDLNKSLANHYFINEINMLHESPDKQRFQVLNTLSARELYFILIGGSGELYTSSFLYVYKRFLKESESEGLDHFFDHLDYYQFTQFIANISGYGLVDDFVGHMQEEKFAALMGKYIGTFQNTQLTDNQVILNAMTMSEVLQEIRHHPLVKSYLLAQLDLLEKPKAPNDIMLQRIFSGLKDILLDKAVYSTDSTYDILQIKRLQKQDHIAQVHLFYDDEDGCMSFNNSTDVYGPADWDKDDRGNYIVFQSRHGNKMNVYMNKPMTTAGYDATQEEMMFAIKQEGFEITSLIHRGHSYYLFQSIKKITASCQFVFLGSCGGYNEVLKVFLLNPDMNIIATRNVGSTLINDPLLNKINMNIVNNKDIVWDELWQDFKTKFQSKLTKDLFSSYIAPNKYIAVKFIRQVFNY